jgi:hypothetical protein
MNLLNIRVVTLSQYRFFEMYVLCDIMMQTSEVCRYIYQVKPIWSHRFRDHLIVHWFGIVPYTS